MAEAVNLGRGCEIGIRELGWKIAELTGFRFRKLWNSSQPNGQPPRCLDVTRAEQEFGFRASAELNEGPRHYLSFVEQDLLTAV
jgi:GDP-L-fucose synthase